MVGCPDTSKCQGCKGTDCVKLNCHSGTLYHGTTFRMQRYCRSSTLSVEWALLRIRPKHDEARTQLVMPKITMPPLDVRVTRNNKVVGKDKDLAMNRTPKAKKMQSKQALQTRRIEKDDAVARLICTVIRLCRIKKWASITIESITLKWGELRPMLAGSVQVNDGNGVHLSSTSKFRFYFEVTTSGPGSDYCMNQHTPHGGQGKLCFVMRRTGFEQRCTGGTSLDNVVGSVACSKFVSQRINIPTELSEEWKNAYASMDAGALGGLIQVGPSKPIPYIPHAKDWRAWEKLNQAEEAQKRQAKETEEDEAASKRQRVAYTLHALNNFS